MFDKPYTRLDPAEPHLRVLLKSQSLANTSNITRRYAYAAAVHAQRYAHSY